MYHHNLLPKNYQNITLRWFIFYQLKLSLTLLTVLLLVLSGLSMTIVQYYQHLTTNLDQLLEAETIDRSISSEYSKNIQQFNARLHSLRTIQQSHKDLTSLLITLSEYIPKEITVKKIDVQFEENTITISGTAEHREDLQTLQANFETDDLFSVDIFPFDIYTQSENIPFAITLSIAPNAFVYEK